MIQRCPPIAEPASELMVAAWYYLQFASERATIEPRLVAAGLGALRAPIPDGFMPLARAASESAGRDPHMTAQALRDAWEEAGAAARARHANQNNRAANSNGAKNSHPLDATDPRVTSWRDERADLK
jgi:hypothetical protein